MFGNEAVEVVRVEPGRGRRGRRERRVPGRVRVGSHVRLSGGGHAVVVPCGWVGVVRLFAGAVERRGAGPDGGARSGQI